MAVRTLERKIGTTVYRVRTLPATQGIAVFATLAPIFSLITAGATLQTAVAAALPRIDAGEFTKAAKTFAEFTHLECDDGRKPRLQDVFDEHFSGELFELGEWIAFCVEVNYATFFAGLIAKFANAIKPNSTDGIPTS